MKIRNKLFIGLSIVLLSLFMLPFKAQAVSKEDKEISICILPDAKPLFAGKSYKLSLSIYNEEYGYSSLTEEYNAKNYTFKSSNTKVATVSSDGKVKGVKAGDATITVTNKKVKGSKGTLDIHIYDGTLTIKCDTKNFTAGKTYQLKSDKKNVKWSIYNSEGEDARASIDSKTGKLKIRNAGEVYIYGETKDGKYFGATYIKATGPMILKQSIELDPIVLKKDKHIVSFTELDATDLLPKTVSVKYKNGKKTGTVKCNLDWGWYNDDLTIHQADTYEIGYKLIAPDGYVFEQDANLLRTISLKVKEDQTDNRIHIVKFQEEKITIKTDKHLVDPYDVYEAYYKDKQLIGITEDGDKVKFDAYGIGYSGGFSQFREKGTYDNLALYAKETPGYVFDEGKAPFTVIVKKPQTFHAKYKDEYSYDLDYIPGTSWVILPTTQKGIK